MFTVAIIGADGAGKTTISRRLERESPRPVKYLYMGVSAASNDRLLPTTRLWLALQRAQGRAGDSSGPPDPARRNKKPKGFARRALASFKETLRLVNQLAEEWYRQGVSWTYRRRGFIVVCDRHFYSDYYAHDIAGPDKNRSLGRRIHGFVLAHLYPRPDLVILLDAPAELLYARKGEGTVELLQRRQQEYWQVRDHVAQFQVVDATQPEDAVFHAVLAHIEQYDRQRSGGNGLNG
ncbi:MAG: hypothetical protein L0332_21240 [Chloroflexi bacterium]|nr:hypothetical protein [Chloroflexota bacterium]MCI0580721.1 hypothetical protein [Chloroflexota bacterium]MCI0646638.1 hypothetical protein [Chloroflexota bacterium]MCI0729221.1 hypothetical protein [Chloroflexota bacterium]